MCSVILVAILAVASSALAATRRSYYDSAYPYVVSDPGTSNPPVMIFLHGSGSRAPASKLNTNVYWDGVGIEISKFFGSQTSGVPADAAGFLTILPLLPTSVMDWDAGNVIKVLWKALEKYHYDPSRVHVSGYSRGAWGAVRTALASPNTFASLVPCAGGTGFSNSQLETLTSAGVDVWYFVGGSDPKVPQGGVLSTVGQLRSVNSAGKSDIRSSIIYGADHQAMGKIPFAQSGTWGWIQQKTRGGSSSSPPPATTSSKSLAVVSTVKLVVQPTTGGCAAKRLRRIAKRKSEERAVVAVVVPGLEAST